MARLVARATVRETESVIANRVSHETHINNQQRHQSQTTANVCEFEYRV